MFFTLLLIVVTTAIAGCAAFFSIYGLAQIFTGAFWGVVIMASSLEAGKLIAASYLYRYRKDISWLMKSYLMAAIIVLMVITSAGIFGYLSSAYQQDTLPLNEMENKITLLDARKVELEQLKTELRNRRAQLNKQVDDLPANFATKREVARQQIQPELDKINEIMNQYNEEIRVATDEQHKLKSQVIVQQVHTGPIVFIAKAFGREIDDATKWMIFLIMFAFDPLAVALTLGINNIMMTRKNEKDFKDKQDSVAQLKQDEEQLRTMLTEMKDLVNEVKKDIPENEIAKLKDKLEALRNKPQLSDAELELKNQLESRLSLNSKVDEIKRKIRSGQ